MKKTLLLSGVACIFALNAQAMNWNINEYRPYVGADYSFFKAKQGNQANRMKKYFHAIIWTARPSRAESHSRQRGNCNGRIFRRSLQNGLRV